MLAEGIESGEVESGAETGADYGGESAAPEMAEGIGAAGYVAEGVDEGGGAGLLDAGFEEIDGLEKGGGEDAGAEAGDEVECCRVVRSPSFGSCVGGAYKMMPLLTYRWTCPATGSFGCYSSIEYISRPDF